jgi:predicted regulator of Ras-like GTPase activity (Roadblock/LC7/MglB family)
MQAIEEALRALRDVQGVHGSFVITMSGALVARDLPSAFDNQLFAEVGPRIARLHETFLSGGEELDACVLRFAEHKLYIRKMSAALIGVLSAVGVNMPALRMVSNLIIRRVDPIIASFGAKLPSPPVTSSSPPPLPVPMATVVAVNPGGSAPPPSPSSDSWAVESVPTNGVSGRHSVIPQDGRDPAPPANDRHVRMYRGRRVDD